MGTHAGLDEVYERLLANPGVVFLLGGLDTGKTTFGIELARRATAAGIETAIVDADIGQSMVGPPTTIGLKCRGFGDFSRAALLQADSLSFVGSIAPRGHMLPLVTGIAKLTQRARDSGARMIVVDTTGFVAGLSGQGLKYYKLDVLAPDFVIGFERGGELEPIIGIAQRFTPAEVIEIEVPREVVVRSVEERMAFREEQFATYFADGTSRWRVKPTVFMPTLPPEFDLALLDALVVGMEDGRGTCVGIGVLEYDAREDILRMVSPIAEGVRGLRLGSIRISTDGRSRGPVDLKQLFQTE
ncbi:MAG: Clp1/GlmU family protein [Actinomycetota bacterium]